MTLRGYRPVGMDALVETFVREHGIARGAVEALLRGAMQPDEGEHTWIEAADLPEHGLDIRDGAALEDEPTEELPQTRPGGELVRYVRLGVLGRGGMGEVVRVYDRVLRRIVAMKILLDRVAAKPEGVDRFLAEAQATSQLEHPGIVPIYDLGRLPGGRAFFTMKQVRGRTLGDLIEEGAPPRRLLEAFRVACEAVAYAHSRGVVHRDIKPDNVLVGEFGEVLVVDWGLVSRVGAQKEREEADTVSTSTSIETSWGVAGTPAYMPPELAKGNNEVGTEADIYALGATLYHLLTGARPYAGRRAIHVLAQVIAGPPPPPRGPHIDEELSALCEAAMARNPSERPTAQHLATAIVGWLEGSSLRARAQARVEEADALAEEAQALRARAGDLADQARSKLAAVPGHSPEAAKHEGWALEDDAAELLSRAEELDGRYVARLRLALNHVAELPAAHDRLARWYHDRHREAERTGQTAVARRMFAQLGDHDRGTFAAYREGQGALTFHTDPPGASVTLRPFVQVHRRLVPGEPRDLGRTPLDAVPLAAGSYLVELALPGRGRVRYPISIDRQQHWDGIRPGGTAPLPIQMPEIRAIAADERLIPAGWLHSGGDPDALNGLPYQRVWVDAFAMKRDPVTVAEYIVFLDDLVARGREADALRYAPRQRSGTGGEAGPLLLGRDANGRFVLVPDAEGDVWQPTWPVLMVDWFGAVAYADWLALRTGQPWRLPVELEWERAARGSDRRIYLWGDFADPSWCANLAAFDGRAMPMPVDAFPVDTSVFGVRGLAGNVRDWTLDPHGGPRISGGIVAIPERVDRESLELRPRRGGAWLTSTRMSRIGNRDLLDPRDRNYGHGFRLVRS